MGIFDELEAQYEEIDNQYSSAEFEARTKGWSKKEQQYQKKRKLNDQAYFLFMFSRLEDHIKIQSASLITKKQTSIQSWRQRAAWDIIPSISRRDYPLINRLALLTEKGGTDYNLVLDYYKERNAIAHGGSFTRSISMPTVITELKRLYLVLKA